MVLVLVDAIGTGFSRAAADAELSKKFWGVKGDIQAFSEFIRLYLTRYERWTSPLFLLGESYGTTALRAFRGILLESQIAFNGITLLSDGTGVSETLGGQQDQRPAVERLLIPSFTMIAGFHHSRSPELNADMIKSPAGIRTVGVPPNTPPF